MGPSPKGLRGKSALVPIYVTRLNLLHLARLTGEDLQAFHWGSRKKQLVKGGREGVDGTVALPCVKGLF